MKKINLFILMILVCLISSCSSKNDKSNYTIVKGKLFVATSPDYAPYEFIDLSKEGNDKFIGSDISLARYIAECLKLELIIKPMSFDLCLEAINSKKVDIGISGFSYTAERASTYMYSQSYFNEGDGGQVFVVNKNNTAFFDQIEKINNSFVKVACQNGSIQAEACEKLLPDASLIKIEDTANALTLLKKGVYSGIVVSKVVADAWLALDDDIAISYFFEYDDSSYYVLGDYENVRLMDEINKVLKKVVNDSLYNKWLFEANNLYANLGNNNDKLIAEDDLE